MRYVVFHNGSEQVVEIDHRKGEIRIGDQVFRHSSSRINAGSHWSVLLDGRSFDVANHHVGDQVTLNINGWVVDVAVQDERSYRALKVLHREGEYVRRREIVRCDMPGLILQVMVSEGDLVEEGTPLCIMEAMKLENEITASLEGCVKKVHIHKGMIVSSGDQLVTIG